MKQFNHLLFMIFLASCNHNPGKTPEEKIDYVVNKTYENGDFIGTVLVANQGQVIYQTSFGMAESEDNIPINDSTKFLIASLSKPITAILILKLTEQGKINLDDEIGKYFNSANTTKVSAITIHQLLTHTSGIAELIHENHAFEASDLSKAKLKFESGSDFQYSNTEYVILKEIAQMVTGKGYATLVEEEIFKPAQMKSSGVTMSLDHLTNAAVGYKTPEQIEPVKIGYSLKLVDGAGSIYSTASDLYKLDRALYSEKLLSNKTIELMQQQHVKEKFGYGWFLRERGGTWDVMYHQGNLPGFTTFFSRRTKMNEAVILLSNSEGVDLSDLDSEISRILKFDN